MKRRHTCQESEEKWKQLLALSKFGSNTASASTNNNKSSDGNNNNNNKNNDWSDCQSMVTPTTRALVDDVLEEFAGKWRALDDRRITQDPSTMTIASTAAKNDSKIMPPPPAKRKYRRGGWEHTQEQLLTLPPNFDYATVRNGPPSPTQYDQHDKVIDLFNPTQQYSYHEELWKLFSKIPTVEEITLKARANAQIPNSLALHQEIVEGTQKVQRMDAHGLCRMRMANRHGLPPPPPPMEGTIITDNNNNNLIGTLRFEFWRRQPKRGSGPDARRMVLEFSSSQTLLDVHKAIVGLTEDDGWAAAQKDTTDDGLFFIEETFYTTTTKNNTTTNAGRQEETTTARNQSGNTNAEEATNTSTAAVDNDTAATVGGENTNGTATTSGSNNTTASDDSSGMDYMTAITQWLDGGGIPNSTRRQYLGIATSNRFRHGTPMKDALLSKIPFRLGVRYYHVMHGDVECSVMVTDKRLVTPNPNTNTTKYPIIHDIWMPNYPVPICEACDRFAAVYVYFHRGTAAQKYQDGVPTALCDNCCKALKLLEKEKDALQLYHVWKNKSELSTAVVRSEQCRFF